jgi:nucleotide-binding universal stress UspA family protein
MYKKILATVNQHLNSEISARYALGLARACSARFYLCFVAEKAESPADIRSAEDAVNRLFLEAQQAGLEVESVTKTGDVLPTLDRFVRDEGIDIVFAASRRKDVRGRFFFGGVTRRILLDLPCSVALVRVEHMGRIQPGRILVPLKTQMGNVAERAYFTCKMAAAFHSRLFVFHTTKPISRFFEGEMHLTPPEWEKRMPGEIEQFMESARTYGVEVEGRQVPGRIARSITIEAASKRHDLIIMGATERGFFSSLLGPPPVEKVMRDTPCDLIILKPAL